MQRYSFSTTKAPAQSKYLRGKLIVLSMTSYRSSRTGKSFRIQPGRSFNRFNRKNGQWVFAKEMTSCASRLTTFLPISKAAEVSQRLETNIWATTRRRSSSSEFHFIFKTQVGTMFCSRGCKGLQPSKSITAIEVLIFHSRNLPSFHSSRLRRG